MITLRHGDSRDLLRTLDADSLDACVTDPPYHLTTGKRGGSGAASASAATPQGRARIGTGFMGKAWDGGDIAADPAFWREVFRVLKPGAHVLAFGGTRTYHRMACAIEDAGFEIRDCIRSEQAREEVHVGWVYGSGMPKSRDMAKAIDKEGGTPGRVVPKGAPVARMIPGADQNATGWAKESGRLYQPGDYIPGCAESATWQGWGTGLKPAWEPIVVARKPFRGTVAANVLRRGTGAVNVDGCRVGTFLNTTPSGQDRYNAANAAHGYRPGAYPTGAVTPAPKVGRWPANLVHDGSDEVEAAFAAAGKRGAAAPASGPSLRNANTSVARNAYAGLPDDVAPAFHNDRGTAARFFYSSKAGKADRAGSEHPTVKPVALMRWLVRLVTPPGGTVLDCFAGSGTTGAAAALEGMNALLMEREPEYFADLVRRFGQDAAGPLFAA